MPSRSTSVTSADSMKSNAAELWYAPEASVSDHSTRRWMRTDAGRGSAMTAEAYDPAARRAPAASGEVGDDVDRVLGVDRHGHGGALHDLRHLGRRDEHRVRHLVGRPAVRRRDLEL